MLGPGLAILDIWTRQYVLSWWALDGRKNIGLTISRTTAAAGAIFFTLYSGWVVVYASLEVALYTIAGIQLIAGIVLSYGIIIDWLPDPPTVRIKVASTAVHHRPHQWSSCRYLRDRCHLALMSTETLEQQRNTS